MKKKRKSRKKFFRLQNEAIRELQIGADFREYKLGQEGLQRWVALGISNRDKKITNRAGISNRGRDYKSGQEGFQVIEGITNYCRTLQNEIQNFS